MASETAFPTPEKDILQIRELITGLAADQTLRQFLGDDFSESLRAWDTVIKKRCEEPFTLVILGDFKRGKSTIINALLGKELAPMNAAPETYTINEISYGEESSVEAVLINGERVPLEMEDITRERLEPLMKSLPDKIDYLDIRDNAELLKELRIVDTPGLSDLDDLDRKVSGYLVNADAIIYVASALLPFSETEQFFLSAHIQPARFGMLYVLVNMVDALSTREDVDKIMDRFRRISEEIAPNAAVYGISGSDEFKRKIRRLRPKDKGFRELYETGFLKFELSIKRDIIMQKDVIRNQRVFGLIAGALSDTRANLEMFSEMSALGRKQLSDISEIFTKECETLSEALESKKPVLHISILEMQQEAEQWMYEFFARLRESVLACRNLDENGIAADDIEKYFYSFLMDKVGEAYRCCLEVHQQRISDLVENMSVQLAKKLGIANLSSVSQSQSFDKLMLTLNKKITRSVMDVKMFGTSETFPPETMMSFRDIMKRKKQTDIIDIVLDNYDDIRANIVKDIKTAYEEFEAKAFDRLDGIYHAQAELGKQTIQQTQEMVSAFDDAQIEEVLKHAFMRLNAAESVLKRYLPSVTLEN